MTVLDWQHGSFAFAKRAMTSRYSVISESWQGFGVMVELSSWLPREGAIFDQWLQISSHVDQQAILRLAEHSPLSKEQEWPNRSP